MNAAAPSPNFSSDSPPGTSDTRTGTISKLNVGAGFGYVSDDDKVHHYIFVFGHALRRSAGAKLRIGDKVRFRTSGQGRVDELVAIRG